MFATINLIMETLNKLKVAKAKVIQSSEPSTGEAALVWAIKAAKRAKKVNARLSGVILLSLFAKDVSTWDFLVM